MTILNIEENFVAFLLGLGRGVFSAEMGMILPGVMFVISILRKGVSGPRLLSKVCFILYKRRSRCVLTGEDGIQCRNGHEVDLRSKHKQKISFSVSVTLFK